MQIHLQVTHANHLNCVCVKSCNSLLNGLFLQVEYKRSVLEIGCSLLSQALWVKGALLRFMQSVSWLSLCSCANEFNTPRKQFRASLGVSDNAQTVFLTPHLAAQCGYTQKLDPWGNTIVSASLKSCFAEKQVCVFYKLSIPLTSCSPGPIVYHRKYGERCIWEWVFERKTIYTFIDPTRFIFYFIVVGRQGI